MSYWDSGKRFVPKREGRGSGDYEFFELSLAQGPTAIGVTGQNRLIDFIGTAWLLLLDLDMELRLFRQAATVGEWDEVTVDLPPVFAAPLPAGARRVSFCFDQSARVVVAYEYEADVYLTRWDAPTNQYVQNVTIDGVDPFVVFDAVWYQFIPNSDVLLFYLSLDRERVLCRVQREIFSIERLIHDYGVPVVMDRVVRVPLRYEVLVSDAAGEPLESGGERVALISDPYPYLGDDLLEVAGVQFGSVAQAVTVRYFEQDDNALDSAFALGNSVAAVATRYFAVEEEPQQVLGVISLGASVAAVVVRYLAVEEEPQQVLGVMSLGNDVVAVLVRVLRVEDDGPFEGAVSLGGVVRASTV